jgi:hypothetical protein
VRWLSFVRCRAVVQGLRCSRWRVPHVEHRHHFDAVNSLYWTDTEVAA